LCFVLKKNETAGAAMYRNRVPVEKNG